MDLPIDEECRLLKRISLTVEGEQEVRKTWLSQATQIMDTSGLDASKFLSKLF
jgi:hypothetical protein